MGEVPVSAINDVTKSRLQKFTRMFHTTARSECYFGTADSIPYDPIINILIEILRIFAPLADAAYRTQLHSRPKHI